MSRIEPSSRADLTLDEKAFGAAIDAAMSRDDAATTSAFDRVIAAVDASHYLLTPRAVVTPQDAAEVAALFAYATAAGEPLTFRSGGTSLSGQASTGNILVDTRRNFRSITVLDDGLAVRVQPGVTVRQVNARLLRHSRKLGPDPASEIACTIGGVVANNSSGMACGTAQNTYQTLRSAIIVLPSGTIVDTSIEDADAPLRDAEPDLWQTLTDLRQQVLADPTLATEIARQFGIKNTMGYGLNSLLDHETPAQILAHLMVGSEGTLGFVAEATFNTVPLLRHAATTLLVFETLAQATDALVDIVATEPATVELMDAASLRAALIDPESRDALPTFEIVNHCALLVEYQSATPERLAELAQGARQLFDSLLSDRDTRAQLGREGAGIPLAHSQGAVRDGGRSAAVGNDGTARGHRRAGRSTLQHLRRAHSTLRDPRIPRRRHLRSRQRRQRALPHQRELRGRRQRGALPGVHRGHGRAACSLPAARSRPSTAPVGSWRRSSLASTAPVLYGMMLEIKLAFDPAGILNPDTILTTDADLHLRNLKSTPTVEEEVDRCVECGYCEPVCPSKDLTTTPRQRIVVQRAIAEADLRGDRALAKELRREQDVRGRRHLCGRRHVPDGLPGAHQHRRPGASAAV